MKTSPNHIISSTDKYNQLVDFIEGMYRELYPEDQYWSTLTVPQMLETMFESAKYEVMYNELLTSNLKESQARSQNLLQSIFMAADLMSEAETNEDESAKEKLGYAINLLETFKGFEETGKTKSRKSRRKPIISDPFINSGEEF